MSSILDSQSAFDAARLAILGEQPDNAVAKVIYERTRIALDPFIALFEQTLVNPIEMEANVPVLSVHLNKIAHGIDSPLIDKLEQDTGVSMYRDARDRFVAYYGSKLEKAPR